MTHADHLRARLAELEADLAGAADALADVLLVLPRLRPDGALERAKGRVGRAHTALVRYVRAPKGKRGTIPAKLQSTFARALRTARLWPHIADRVEEQIAAEPVDLGYRAPQMDPQIAPLGFVYDKFVAHMHRMANPHVNDQSDDAQARQMYDDIPLSMAEFMAGICAAYRVCLAQRKTGPLRFLDVGCGGGTKLLAAEVCFERCDGIEYDPRTAQTGAAMMAALGRDGCRVMQADAYEFTDYAAYDVIYYYRPMMLDDAMLRLETLIFEAAAPGTVIFAPFDLVTPDLSAVGAAELAHSLYIAGTPAAEAERLRRDAETMGTAVPGYRRWTATNPGYWRGLMDACAANGHPL
ncbi:MAG: class I SAM-dependent methyltransferase [Pseudomonadota bacterium]